MNGDSEDRNSVSWMIHRLRRLGCDMCHLEDFVSVSGDIYCDKQSLVLQHVAPVQPMVLCYHFAERDSGL